MNFKLVSLFCFLFLLSEFAFAANPDVNNFSASFHQSYVKNDSVTFTFDVTDTDVNGIVGSSDDLNAQVWLVKDFNANRTDYIGDFNLMGGGALYAICTDTTDFNTGTNCSITFTLAETTDGNYWFDLNVYQYNPLNPTTVVDQNTVRSQDYDLNFYIDNTAPTSVTDLTVKDNKNKTVSLNWKALSSVTPLLFSNFKTYYSNTVITSCTSGTLDTTSTDGTLITDNISSLNAGQNYWFCVLVSDVAGNTTDSAIVFSPVTDEVIGGTVIPVSEEELASTQTKVQAQLGSIGIYSVGGINIPAWFVWFIGIVLALYLVYSFTKTNKTKRKRR